MKSQEGAGRSPILPTLRHMWQRTLINCKEQKETVQTAANRLQHEPAALNIRFSRAALLLMHLLSWESLLIQQASSWKRVTWIWRSKCQKPQIAGTSTQSQLSGRRTNQNHHHHHKLQPKHFPMRVNAGWFVSLVRAQLDTLFLDHLHANTEILAVGVCVCVYRINFRLSFHFSIAWMPIFSIE